MNRIDQITEYAGQNMSVVLDDGSSFYLSIAYKPMQYGWFIQELSYGDFKVQGMRITCGVNILRQFSNEIPFGLCCTCVDGREPTQQQDFSSGSANLYVLTEDEVQQYEDFLNGV